LIYTLLVFGDLFFWLVALIAFGVITACVENEKGFGATVVLFVTVVSFTLFTDFNIFATLAALDYWYLAILILGYFIVGTGWCVFKWYLFLIDRKEEAENIKENSKNIDPKDIKNYIKQHHEYKAREFPPQVSHHKDDILLWGCYWPFSLVWTVLGDFLIRIWNRIYTLIKNFLQNMSNRIFKNV